MGQSWASTEAALALTWRLVAELGFFINTEKSKPTPSQCPTFLGASLDLQAGLARPSRERLRNLKQCVSLFLATSGAPARAWLRLLGLMASMVDVPKFCRLRMRPIQLHLLSFYRPSRNTISHLVPTSAWLDPHLRWWLHDANLLGGLAFRKPRPSLTVTTDASLSGWGATLGQRQVAGCWGPEHSSAHINVLELLAVTYALECFRRVVVGQAVLVESDNTTVVSYINRQGGTRSPQLCTHTWELLHWCIST